MTKPVQIPNYLLPGLIILLAVTGNQIKEASSIRGLRRNWEVIATYGGTQFPTFRDNGTTNTGIIAVCNLDWPFDGYTSGCKESLRRNGMFRIFKNKASLSSTPENSKNAVTANHESIYFQSCVFTPFPGFLIIALYSTLLRNNRSALFPWSHSFKDTFRYLERLPGH